MRQIQAPASLDTLGYEAFDMPTGLVDGDWTTVIDFDQVLDPAGNDRFPHLSGVVTVSAFGSAEVTSLEPFAASSEYEFTISFDQGPVISTDPVTGVSATVSSAGALAMNHRSETSSDEPGEHLHASTSIVTISDSNPIVISVDNGEELKEFSLSQGRVRSTRVSMPATVQKVRSTGSPR
jgi:hypothetical protein